MLQKVSIQNFKSLKDVTLELQKVNLLIGPNNSGKSNFLKALERFKKIGIDETDNNNIQLITKSSDFFKKIKNEEMIFNVEILRKEDNVIYNATKGIRNDRYDQYLPNSQSSISITAPHWNTHDFWFDDSINGIPKRWTTKNDLLPIKYLFEGFFNTVEVYRPDPNKIIIAQDLKSVKVLNSDCSNLIAFLFTLSIDDEIVFQRIQTDFANCVLDFVRIKTPPINTDEGGKLSLKFFDKDGNDYWADEVSEGVLYFLALLCIVHQPNPPKLLLLEEPEKGIHPRRIKEVIDFIFQLTEDKDIQVIMTTHSERVLDEFEDIPEAVFIFDKDEEGATQVKNLLKDIIEPSDKLMEKNGVPRIKFTDSLGSHWVTGFIGGVPR
jgi:predicted ATPase